MQTKLSNLLTCSVAVFVSGMVNAALVYGFVASEPRPATAALADTSAVPAAGLIVSAANLPATDHVERIVVVGKRPSTAALADTSTTPAVHPTAPSAGDSAKDCLERVIVVSKRPVALQRVVVTGTRPVISKSSYGVGPLSAPQPSTP